MDRGDSLFTEFRSHAVVDAAVSNLTAAIGGLSDTHLFDRDQDELINDLVAAHRIEVPALNTDAIVPSEREVKVDVSQDHGRLITDRRQPFHVNMTEVSFRVPYNGDRDVFRFTPSRFSLNPPYADVEDGAITIRVVRQDQDPAEYRKEFDQVLTKIQDALTQLRGDCANLDERLRQTAVSQLQSRRDKRQKDRNLIDGLGFSNKQND